MKRMTHPSWCAAIAAAVFLLMCGCAVMTVDVDVYKGPLANERDVQLHQVAVMAVGAKPLLKQFRDVRELSAHASNAPDATKYRELAKDAPNEIIGYEFTDSAASRANEVLSLYSSRQRHRDPLLAQLIDQHQEAGERYSRAYSALRGQPLPETRTRLHALMMSKGVEPLEALQQRKDPPPTPRERARSAYAEAIAPKPVGNSWLFYEADLWIAYKELPHRKDNRGVLLLKDKTNTQFEFLAKEENVRKDVQAIFDDLPKATREQIVEVATAAASGFLDAREALADLLLISIDMLERVNDPSFATTARAEISEEATRQLTDHISDLISSNSFTNALKADPREQDALTWLGLKKEGDRLFTTDTRESFPRNRARERLADAIIRDPRVSIEHLRRLHNSLVGPDQPFGIASGPMESDKDLLPDFLDQQFQSLVNALQGGFSRGRHEKGLDDIIDDFVSAATNASEGLDQDGALDRKRKVLLEALVQYAEKVLFVTDHASLVDGGGGGTRVVHEPSSIRITHGGRDIRVGNGELSVQARNDAYLLQAIGNSILVQVNELVAHDAYSRGEKLAYARLRDNTTTIGEETEESPRAIMDRIIFRIESCLREEVTANGHGSEKAKNLAATLALAYEQRARMVYIRPPSFYLKNSYPVTSLVDNQHQGLWKNMLAQQAGRSVPLFGEGIEGGRRERENAAKLQHEIDGRFWQNINRIRVAGAGRTNYALVKDAVGNWNVKSFTADPDPIIKAAQASFLAASGGLPLASGLGTTLTPPALPNPRDTRVDHLKEIFAQRTRDDARATSEFIKSLPSQVKVALAADPLAARIPGLGAAVDSSHADILGSTSLAKDLESDAGGPATEEAILQSLRSLRRYRDALAASISTAEIPDDVADPHAARQAAHRVLDARITRPLSDLISRRVISVEGHRAALQAMHEMLTDPAPPTPPAPPSPTLPSIP